MTVWTSGRLITYRRVGLRDGSVRRRTFRLLNDGGALALALSRIIATILIATQPVRTSVSGVWRGESVCAPDRPACVNERVIYYISPIDGKSDVVLIRADKIVNGQSVTMGTSEWTYDTDHETLIWQMPRQTWRLKIGTEQLDGTLTLIDNTVVRRLTLKRDP